MCTVKQWFRNLSLARKLIAAGVITGTASFALACAVLVAYDLSTSRQQLVRDTGLLGDVVGANSTAALAFGDAKAASEALGAVAVNRHIVSAALLLRDGSVFARYQRDRRSPAVKRAVDPEALRQHHPWQAFTDSGLLLIRPIVLKDDAIGSVVIESDLSEIRDRMIQFGGIIAIILLGALSIALVVASRLQRVISMPLLELTNVTKAVTRDHTYAVRVEKSGDDEIGELIDGFNEMLREIEDRDRRLLDHQQQLEGTVDARTAELRAANADLMGARDKAMEASRAKSEFLANMSREIRTPMNGIIGMTEIALETELTEQQRDYLATVKSSAVSLLTILNDILDFSKIESRKLELESIQFSVRDLVTRTLKALAVKAHEKGLELLCDIQPEIPDDIVGDPVRLQQVLSNLIGNAIKFTERGHVLLAIQQEGWEENAIALHFQVSDTGIGIPPEKQATIFEAFSQADGSTTRRFGGTGLGLTISATLVQLMGGRMWVESEQGGSTFHFLVRLERSTRVTPSPSPEPVLAELPVLIVDDNSINRRILYEQLTRWQTRVTAVDSGYAALDTLSAAASAGTPFAIVLLDANMPGLDGFGVAERMAKRPDLAGATVMMLTSSGRDGDAARCAKLGIAAYLTKPIQAAELHDAICVALNRKTQAHGDRPVTPVAARAAVPLCVLLAEDNVVNQQVAVGLLTKRGHQVTVANDGVEALAALERGRFDIILMDLQMPKMGGLEVTKMIRERERASGDHVRIVAMTAHAMRGDRERCLAAGMDGYVSKPIDAAVLFAMVEYGGISVASNSSDSPRPSTPIDHELVMNRLGGDEQLFAQVVQMFLEDAPLRLAAIKAAVDRRDVEQLCVETHGLKGAAGNLSAGALFEAARALERIGTEGRLDEVDAAWHRLSAAATEVLDALRRFEKEGLPCHA